MTSADRLCPRCGATMTIDVCEVPTEIGEPYHLRSLPVPIRLVRTRVALCNGCEYVERVR